MKRLFSMLLALTMVLSTIPFAAFADGSDSEATTGIKMVLDSDLISALESTETTAAAEETELVEGAEAMEVTAPAEETEAAEATEAAEEAKPAREVESFEIPFTVNPIYEGIYTESDFPRIERPETTGGEEADHGDLDFWQEQERLYAATYLTVEEAGKQLKEHLLNRTERFTLYFKGNTSDFDGRLNQMIENAMAHTGKPKEGDYLRWHIVGWGGTYGRELVNNEWRFVYNAEIVYFASAAQEKELDTTVTKLLNSLNLSGKSEYEKIKAVYDYVCQNITYDYANLEDETYLLKHSAYAALVNKTAVCQGYATLIYRLLLASGVDVRVIPGLDEEGYGHAWNIVKIGEVYYNLDATWDAGYDEYLWFLRCPLNFPYHYRTLEHATTQFHQQYPMAEEDYTEGTEGKPEQYFVMGLCGDNVAFAIDREQNLVIAGEGPMWDFSEIYTTDEEHYPPWFYWMDAFSHVIIEEGVTNVGKNAFATMKNVTDVTLADSVVEIRSYAFESCRELTVVTMGAGLRDIRYGAFGNCAKLEKVDFPEGLVSIGSSAFENTALTEVIIPDSLTSLGSSVFENCSELQKLKIGSSLQTIPGYTFANATALTELTLPETLQGINSHAFEGCTGLTEITIPANITKLGGFEFCTGITKITFLGDAPEIDGTAFARITATVYYPADNDTWTGEKQKNYDGTLTWIRSDGHEHDYSGIVTPPTCTEMGYTIFTCDSCGVTFKGAYTETAPHEFGEWYVAEEADCSKHGLEKRDCVNCEAYESKWINQTQDHVWDSGVVTDPTCTELGFTTHTCTVCGKSYVDTYVKMLGHTPGEATCSEEALCTVCGAATGVYEPHTYDDTLSRGNASGHWHECIHCDGHDAPQSHTPNVEYATNETAMYCTICGYVIEDILDYSDVTVVDEGLWDSGPMKWKLTSDGVLTLYAGHNFQGKTNYIWKDYADQIRRVVIADGVKNVAKNAFSNLPNLTSVYLGNTIEYIAENAFSGCDKLYEIIIPASVTEIKREAFYGCSNLASLIFEEGSAPKTIRKYAFSRTGITKLSTPTSLTKMEESAFEDCKSLREVYLAAGLTDMGINVFKGCTAIERIESYGSGIGRMTSHPNLKTVVLTGDVSSLVDRTFKNCVYLTDVTLGENITQIQYETFYNCTSLKELNLHDKITMLGDDAFAYSGLVSLTIPASVTKIGSRVFQYSDIEEITFLGDAPNFAEDAFDGITATVIYRGNNPTWTEDKIQNYGGNITWVDLDYHEHVYKTETVEPTCTEGGYTTYTCTICEKSHVADEIEKLGHDLSDWVVDVEETCITDGSKTRACQREGCDFSETEVITAPGHSYVPAVTAPTCTEGGYTTHTCHCGDSYVSDETAALGHDVTYEVETAPTLEAEGKLAGSCTRCGEKLTVTLPKLGKTAYTLEVITEPTKEAEGFGKYTWTVTDYGTFTFEAAIPNVILGDVNDDGAINVVDLMYLANYFAKGETINKANADVNNDGTVDVRDLMFLANVFAGKETLG